MHDFSPCFPSRPPVSAETKDTSVPTTTEREPQESKLGDHVTGAAGHVTSDGLSPMATLDSPFSRSRSLTVSGGGRPKFRPRKPKKTPSGQSSGTDLSHVMSHDSQVTGGSDVAPSAETVTRTTEKREEGEEEEVGAGGRQRDEQYIMKCQVG